MSRRQSVPGADRRARYEAVFGEVYEPLQRYVLRRAPAQEADDVVAEALTVLWRRLDDVPADAVLAWAYGVARRCLANQRRSEVRRAHLAARVQAEATVPMGLPAEDPALDAALRAAAETAVVR
ncbi:MAG: sigma factor, partial [Actinomycetota bacterium]